jgi:tetratricopeptide (TPR) repeat protein
LTRAARKAINSWQMNTPERPEFRLRNPVHDARTLREVRGAMASSDMSRAVLLACRALDDGLTDPLLFYLRAQFLIQQGKQDEAVRDLTQAAMLAPADARMRIACGADLIRLKRNSDAIDMLKEAVRLEPSLAPGHFNLGWAHEHAGELAPAAACYEKAVALDSRYASALARLAGVALRLGDLQTARDYANRALAIDPNEYHALSTEVDVALAQNEQDRAEACVQRLLALQHLPPDDHAGALRLLGDLRHAQGHFADAFEAYASANAETEEFFKPQFGQSGKESFTNYIAWLTAYFVRASGEQWRACADDIGNSVSLVKGHAFIAGFPRSGTTLLENILAAHPQVTALGEKATMADALRDLLSNEAGRDRLAELTPVEVGKAQQLYWRRVGEFGAVPDGKVFVDENPLNTPWLPLVAKLFPHARVIFTLRDPRDVVFSCFRRYFEMNLAMYEFVSLERAARFYAATMQLAAIYREKLGLAWIDVRHESLVQNFEEEMTRVCGFLGLPYDRAMREFAKRARTRSITTASAAQIVRGLNDAGVGQWRNYASALAPILPILAPWVEKFGYPAD